MFVFSEAVLLISGSGTGRFQGIDVFACVLVRVCAFVCVCVCMCECVNVCVWTPHY